MESTHTVIARFEQQDDAREAMVDLERKGIDADAIHVAVPASNPVPTNAEVMASDMRVGRKLARRGAEGAVLGALGGAALVTLVLVAIGVRPLSTAVLVGIVAGAVGGSFIGGFWGVGWRLPVNDEAFDTYVVDVRDDVNGVVVEVTLDDPRVEADAVAVLRHHHARQIDRESH